MAVTIILDGEVAEWLKAAPGNGRYTVKSRIGGSNPSPLRQCLIMSWRYRSALISAVRG